MTIDEKTKIPLFAVVCAIPFLLGGMLWMTSIDSKASVAKEEIESLRPMLIDVHDRVIRIEEQVKHR